MSENILTYDGDILLSFSCLAPELGLHVSVLVRSWHFLLDILRAIKMRNFTYVRIANRLAAPESFLHF